MKEADDHMKNCDFARIPQVPNKHLWDQLWALQKEVKHANQKAVEAVDKVKKMEECLELAKTKIGALLDAKENATQESQQQVKRQETQAEQEKLEDLEQYVHIQEEHYAKQLSQLVLKKTDMHTEHQQQKQLEVEKNELVQKYSDLEVKYEEKGLALLVAEAKPMFDQEAKMQASSRQKIKP